MKKWSIFLIILTLLFSTNALAEVAYPVQTDATLTMWRILDPDIVNGGYTSANDTPGVKNWIAKTGINLEISEFADFQSLSLALQADDLPDMMLFDYNLYSGAVMGLVSDGLVTELTPEMFAENAPDFWQFINSMDLYSQYLKQLDGKIYHFPSNLFEANSIYRFWRQFMFRGDMLEEYGLSVPTGNQEFKDLLVFARDNIEGIEIPFLVQDYQLVSALDDGYFSAEYDLVRCGEFQIDGTYHYGRFEPAYRELLAYMNELYNEGLISVDFAATDEPTAQNAFVTGKSIAIFCNNSRLNSLKTPVAEDGGYILPGGPLHRADQDAAFYAFTDPYITTQYSMYISSESKQPELCLQFLNYLFTEEGNIMRNYGTEGVTFEYVDGVPTYMDYVTKNSDGYSLDVMMRAEALINWPGIHADQMNAQRHPEKTQRDSYAIQEAQSQVDKYTVVYTGVLEEYLDEYTSLWTDINTYMNESRTKFISGQLNLTNDFDAYMETLRSMGMDRVIEIKQATLDAFNDQ